MNEEKLAEQTINWLSAQNWEIYQEVQVFQYGHVADIVAKQNNLIWIVECKLSLSLAVIEQAVGWKKMAHFVSISTLHPHRQMPGRNVAKKLLGIMGIGLIEFQGTYGRVFIEPKLNRKAVTHHIVLTQHHKTWAKAGNADRNYWTPFQETCRKVKEIVEENPGILIKQIIELLDRHHYSNDTTAKSCLLQWAKLGKIPGIEIHRIGKYQHFYPKDEYLDGILKKSTQKALEFK